MPTSLWVATPPASPRPLRTSWTWLDTGIVFLLVAAATISWLPRTRGPIDLRWDSAVYYLLGTSIADNLSYRLLNEPGEIPATIFPPLLPAVVASHQWLLGTSDPVLVGAWLRVTFWLLLSAYFVGAYVLLRTRLPAGFAVPGVVLCTLDWFPHWLSDRCYSDLPFAVCATAVFLFSSPAARQGAASGAFAIASFLLRSAGIALLAGWVAERLVIGDWKRALRRLALALCPVVIWQGYVLSVEHGASYQRPAYPYQRAAYNIYNVGYSDIASLRDHRNPHLGEATRRERIVSFIRNASTLPMAMGGAVSGGQASWEVLSERIEDARGLRFIPAAAIPVVLGLLGAVMLIGLARQAAEGEVVIPVALLVYAGTVCVMPTSYMYELPRYMVVFAPPLAMALMDGVRLLQARISAHVGRIAGLLFSLVILVEVCTLAHLFRNDSREVQYSDWRGHRVPYRLFTYDRSVLGQDHAIEWLNQHARRDAIVASSSPQWMYLRTGLRTVMPPMQGNAAEIRRLLDAVPISYVVVEGPGSFTGRYAAPVVRELPEHWRRVIWDPENEFEMYERRLH